MLRQINERLKPYFPVFLWCMLFSYLVYHSLIANGLVNTDDGLWEYSYYKSGSWSLSLGRWFSLYFDRLRFGIQTEPVNALTALACFSAGLIVVFDALAVRMSRKMIFLASSLFLGSVSVCITLSYRFMSPNFAMAFLLAVCAAWVSIKVKKFLAAVIAGGVLLALSLGLYQAYIGCTCLVILGWLMISLCDEKREVKAVFFDMLKGIMTGVAGAAFYYLALTVHLRFFHLELSDYNGANTYSLYNTVKSLGLSIPYTYRTFGRFYLGNMAKINLVKDIYYVVFAIVLLFAIKKIVQLFKVNKIKALLFAVFTGTVPLACGAVFIITTNVAGSLQMMIPMSLCLTVILCVEMSVETWEKKWRWVLGLNLVALLVVLYGSILQIQIDQESMLEGRTSTAMLGERIIDKLDDTGNLEPGLQYCVLGIAAYNNLFSYTRIMDAANAYARVGGWNEDYTCMRRSWQSVFEYLCGFDLEICSSSDYAAMLNNPSVQAMPVFPEEGSIARIGDIVVVKVSE